MAAPGSDSQSEMVPAEIVATPVAQGQLAAGDASDSASGPGMVSRSSGASRTASPTSVTNLILPLAGLALIAVGIVLALAARKRGAPKAE